MTDYKLEPDAYISHTPEGDVLSYGRQWDALSHTPLYTALQVTALQPAPDVSALVEALDLALEYWRDRQQRYKNRRPKWVVAAESALAAYRKQQESGA